MLQTKDLTKRYEDGILALDHLNLEVNEGEIFCLLGANGAGKTTTMRMLATLEEPTDGDAFVDGVSVVQQPEKTRPLVGFMPDSLPAHKDITAWQYLDFFGRAHGVRNPRRREMVAAVMDFTGLFRGPVMADSRSLVAHGALDSSEVSVFLSDGRVYSLAAGVGRRFWKDREAEE